MSVQILVPEDSLRQVREALGPAPSVRFNTRASERRLSQLLVSPLGALGNPSGRSTLDALLPTYREADALPIVLLGFLVGTAGLLAGLAIVEGYGRLSRSARREPFIAHDPETFRRIVWARQRHAQKELIAAAAVEDGKLVVWSCEPTRYEVAISELPGLAALDPARLAAFELSGSGSRLRWDREDVDLNLDTIREHADPDLRRAHQAKARKEAAKYGSAIRTFRKERGLKQGDITGLSERQLRRLEQGEAVPQVATLGKLAAAHGMSINDYLGELAKRSRPAGRRVRTKAPPARHRKVG